MPPTSASWTSPNSGQVAGGGSVPLQKYATPFANSTLSSSAAPTLPSTNRAGYMPGTRLPIPASGTVLSLTGLNFNLVNDQPSKFQGVFSKPPYTMKKVDYPASLSPKSIDEGVKNLDAMIKATPGPKIILAHSQGAQVASRWMREHANDPDAPPAGEVTFVLTGNPLRSGGGGAAVGQKEVDGHIGEATPTDTPWPIVDVARRYDGWADQVQDTSNAAAVENAMRGRRLLHLGYSQVDLTDPTMKIWQNGNTTFALTQEDPLIRGVDQAEIEAAYQRPA